MRIQTRDLLTRDPVWIRDKHPESATLIPVPVYHFRYQSFFIAGEQGGDLVRSVTGRNGHLLPDGQRGHQPGHCSPHSR